MHPVIFSPTYVVIINVKSAKQNVIAIFPVTFTPSGVRPKILQNQTKKNIVKENS